jgi:RES domain-containing protein
MPQTKLSPLPKEFVEFYKQIGEQLRHHNRFSLSPKFDKIVQDYVDWHIKNKIKVINPGAKYFRARINPLEQAAPFEISKMGAPPKGLPTSGRINPEGISYLYLADQKETALAEVRPWRSAIVTIAEFEVCRPARIVSLLSRTFSNFKDFNVEKMDDLRRLVKGTMNAEAVNKLYFSAPAHGNDRLAYLPSQYLAELLKSRGVDGIEYESVLNPGGVNIALFNPEFSRALSVSLRRVQSISYTSEDIAQEINE